MEIWEIREKAYPRWRTLHLSKCPSDFQQKRYTRKWIIIWHSLYCHSSAPDFRNRLLAGWYYSSGNQKPRFQCGFLKLILATKRITPCGRAVKRNPENGFFLVFVVLRAFGKMWFFTNQLRTYLRKNDCCFVIVWVWLSWCSILLPGKWSGHFPSRLSERFQDPAHCLPGLNALLTTTPKGITVKLQFQGLGNRILVMHVIA